MMQTIRVAGPQTTPTIPPVKNLRDHRGQLITLDSDAIINRHRGMFSMSEWVMRGRIVSIGDPGLPGHEIIRFRPYGSTYLEACSPADVELHTFDDYGWLEAETAAAKEAGDPRYLHGSWGEFQRHGADLTLCQFGGFWFEKYQRAVMRHYLAALEVA